MDTLIRIAIIILSIALVIDLLGILGVWDKILEGINMVLQFLPSLIAEVSPYLSMGRSLLNIILGFPPLVDICLWFSLLSPVVLGATKLTVFIYSKFAG